MNHQSYLDRALKARDPRYRTIFARLGYATKEDDGTPAMSETSSSSPPATPTPSTAVPQQLLQPPATADTDSVSALRQEYTDLFGKKPFNGWNAEMLAQKIAEKRAAD